MYLFIYCSTCSPGRFDVRDDLTKTQSMALRPSCAEGMQIPHGGDCCDMCHLPYRDTQDMFVATSKALTLQIKIIKFVANAEMKEEILASYFDDSAAFNVSK